jgi:hypothetical protein
MKKKAEAIRTTTVAKPHHNGTVYFKDELFHAMNIIIAAHQSSVHTVLHRRVAAYRGAEHQEDP